MNGPKIYLSVDNCFASKRWTHPQDWMKVISECGIHYVEASADNECDPLYMDEAYLSNWTKDIRKHAPEYQIQIANLYSGTSAGIWQKNGREWEEERLET